MLSGSLTRLICTSAAFGHGGGPACQWRGAHPQKYPPSACGLKFIWTCENRWECVRLSLCAVNFGGPWLPPTTPHPSPPPKYLFAFLDTSSKNTCGKWRSNTTLKHSNTQMYICLYSYWALFQNNNEDTLMWGIGDFTVYLFSSHCYPIRCPAGVREFRSLLRGPMVTL